MRLSERSDLPFIGAREGDERLPRELKGTRETKTNRQHAKRCAVRIQAPLQQKRFSFRLTIHIPVVRGKNLDIGSFPQPASRCDEAWRGEAGGGGGARVDVPLILMLIQVGKEPPL